MPYLVRNTSRRGTADAGSTISVGGVRLRVGQAHTFDEVPPEARRLAGAGVVAITEVSVAPERLPAPPSQPPARSTPSTPESSTKSTSKRSSRKSRSDAGEESEGDA